MDDDLIEATWMQLLIEMEKRLNAMEQILNAAKKGGIDVGKMNRLFSLLRSIEGLSKSAWLLAAELRFYGTQEWLVDALLDETVILDISTVSSLLDLIDGIKALHEKAKVRYVDLHPNLWERFAISGAQMPDVAGAAKG